MPAERKPKAIDVRKIIGGGLLVAGSVVMVASLGLLGFQFRALLNNSPTELLGSCAGPGLVSLRLVQSLLFHDAAVFSAAYRILVLFSAFAATVAGLIMLRNRATRTPAS